MASAKSSRSRILNNTAAKSNNPKDSGNKLQENLNVFKSDNFDADGFVQSKCNSLNEKLSFSDRLSGHLVVQAEIFNSQLLAVLQ
ncbi:exocyst complex component EXO84B-like, partial [Camellia sinensis]